MISEFIFNITCNIIASFIFIFTLLIFFKPKFDIVHFIAKNDSPFDNVTDICYSFKIINKSFFGAYDIEARSNYYYIRQGENGIINKVFSKIELKTNKVNFIFGFKPLKKNYGDNCVQFFTYEDLSAKMESSSTYIQFQITARHSLTGLNNIFTYNFVNKSKIVEGKFKEGNFKEIIKC
ncbi:hypothetical protein KHA90_08535 [Flavobacterium psychroterrae]|uniref:Uncharacterized protein n=1 Tax=Flavobacterium psychroterrae TaxID=2133767 RepID=A0ABS5PB48_9FLAO|nr:hypothetical protein [Flavobacterium psychroterrae]MBS7231070.1 hypothetical protein [Flavobacterium psychroterrae]